MDWLFDNIVIIAIIGSAIARWLSGLKEDKSDSSPSRSSGRGQVDVEQVERNRKLREEIRRKREQRRSGQTSSAPSDRPAYNPHVPEQIPPVLREMLGIPEQASPPVQAPTPPPVPEINPVLERQERMELEIVELEAKRKEAEAMARKAGFGQNSSRRRRRAKRSSDLSERDFLATLRDPSQARRAILLREILGKPVGMR